MPPPTFVNAGVPSSATTSISPALPGSLLDNDIVLGLGESNGGQNYPTIASNGFAHVGPDGSLSSPVVQGTNTQLSVVWRRWVTGVAAYAWGDSGDHNLGAHIAVRGCPTVGNPWNVGAVTTEATADNSIAWPTVTTTVADCLVFLIAALGTDIATAEISAITGTHSLTSVTERLDTGTTSGAGGFLICYSGIKTAVGNIGNPTATVTTATSAFKALMTLAMAPAPATAAPKFSILTAPPVSG
jgi:hypothetical protein